MTVIAWDGRSVAADTLATAGGYRDQKPSRKIVRRGDYAYGIVGYPAWFEAWIKWHERGADPAFIPSSGISADDAGNFLVFKADAAFVCSARMPYLAEVGAPDAWGSGCDFAIGAMHAGADAREAVAIAIACSPSCGGSIDVIELLPPPPTRAARRAEVTHLPYNGAA